MSWNEPGKGRDPWGGRDGQNAPDLAELVRSMQRKLSGLFGGGRRGGGTGGSEGAGTVVIVLIVIVALLAFEMVHIIEAGQRGIVLRFGEHVATLEPGPAVRLPRPIERVIRVDVEEVEQFTHKALAAESAVREVAGKTTMDFILGSGRAEVAAQTAKLLQSTLDSYQSGIDVIAVNLVDAQPPEAVQSAFEDAIRAREDQERIINEAQAYANDVLPRARGAAARQIEEANAYREGTVARAQGEANRFLQILAEYERAPSVTRERLYLETIEAVLGASSKVLIDTDNSGNLMYLPLDQLMRGDIRPVPVPSDGAPSRNTQPPPSTPRTRDDDRSRNP